MTFASVAPPFLRPPGTCLHVLVVVTKGCWLRAHNWVSVVECTLPCVQFKHHINEPEKLTLTNTPLVL